MLVTLQQNTLPILVATDFGEVQLRWSCIDHFSLADLERLTSFLTRAEKEHVQNAKTDQERLLRLVARGVLREELASRTGLAPALVPLQHSATGKPNLVQSAGSHLNFNLSHSHAWVVHVFASGFEVGVDLEKIEAKNVTWEALGEPKNGPVGLADLPESERIKAFFEQWVSKEATAKATAAWPARFTALAGGENRIANTNEANTMRASTYQVIKLVAPSKYAAALAICS